MIDEQTKRKIGDLRAKGLSISAIATATSVSRPTVRKCLRGDRNPRRFHPAPEWSRLTRPIAPKKLILEDGIDTSPIELEAVGPSVPEEGDDGAQAQEENPPVETEEKSSAGKDQDRTEQRNKWVRDWQSWAETYAMPWGISFPSSVKFRVKDKVAEILRGRSVEDDWYGLRDLIKEEVARAVIQPYLDEEEGRKKRAEAEKKGARRLDLIKSSLAEVDQYIRNNNLDSYVTYESRANLKNLIHQNLLKTLPEEISTPPVREVREMLGDAFRETKQKIQEAAELTDQEQRKKEKIGELVMIGTGEIPRYILENQDELESVDYQEKKEAEEYLEEALLEEIEGNETEQEIKELSLEILDEFFFEQEDEDFEDDNSED